MAQHAATTGRDTPTSRPVGQSPLETVVVHGSDIRVERAHAELPLAEARSRYGGIDAPAFLAGALAGLGAAALLGALLTAAGSQVARIGGVGDDELALGGVVTAVLVLALSGLVAGWVAGRVARFDGVRNGLLAGAVLLLLLAALGAAGGYAASETADLPGIDVDRDTLTTAALIGAVVALAATLAAAAFGGRLGARWHRSVDDLLLGTRPGAVTRSDDEEVVR
jgi:hypothetical protein